MFRSEYRSTGERKRNVGTVEYVAVFVFGIWREAVCEIVIVGMWGGNYSENSVKQTRASLAR